LKFFTIGYFYNFARKKAYILNSLDWVSMLQNLANSFLSLENLAGQILIVVGLGVIIGGVYDLAVFGMSSQADPNEKIDAIVKILIGVALIYLPTSLHTVTTSFFGADNPLTYEKNPTRSVYGAVKIIMQLAGIVWFSRGLLGIMAEDRGHESSYRSVAYIAAGTCALNLDYTVAALNYAFNVIKFFFEKVL
jgi:hypothetical protein